MGQSTLCIYHYNLFLEYMYRYIPQPLPPHANPPPPPPPLTSHENWGSRWEEQAIVTCRDGGHRQTQVHCVCASTVRLESLLHTLLAALTNWSHQYTSGVGPNNTCVLASLSTGEAGSVDAKVHGRPRLVAS